MRATAKTRIPQLIRSSEKPDLVPAFFLDSSTRVCMVDPTEIYRCPQLAAVILFSATCVINRTASADIATHPATDATERDLFALLHKAERQLKGPNAENEAVFGDVTVNFPEMVACRNGEPVDLTTMEFKTLKYLIWNARRVISRDELLNEVWGYESYPRTRTVDNHILRLRQKLEREPPRPVHFLTVHGAGYKFLP